MCIRECINIPVKGYSFLDTGRIIKFLFSLYKITDKVAYQDLLMLKRKVCMGEVVDRLIVDKLSQQQICPTHLTEITD